MTPLPAEHRPMHYCALCLQAPERCSCVWVRQTVTAPAAALLPLPPDPPPDEGGQRALPIEWPERSDIA